MTGDDPISKLHKKLKALAPEGEEIAQYGLSQEALEYFRTQLIKMGKKQGMRGDHLVTAVGMAELQYAPSLVEGATGFQVYFRKLRK